MQSSRDHLVYFQVRLFAGNAPRKTQQAGHQSFYSASKRSDFVCNNSLALPEIRIVHQQIGISQDPGEWIIYFMRCTCCKLPERNKLFGLNHLLLNVLQVIEGLASAFQQPYPIMIHQSLPRKNKQCHHECCYLRNSKSKCPHRRWI